MKSKKKNKTMFSVCKLVILFCIKINLNRIKVLFMSMIFTKYTHGFGGLM